MVRALSYPVERFKLVMRSGYPTSPLVLAGTRIGFCMYFLLVGINKTAWLGNVPDQLYNPPNGVPQILGQFPSESVGLATDMVGIALLVAVGVGWRTRTNSYLLFAWSILSSAMVFSLGKVDHTFLTWLLVPLFATAGWGDQLSVDSRSSSAPPSRPTWPVAAMAFMTAFGFLTAAIPKLLRGWLSPTTQATEGYFREAFVTQERTALLAPQFANIDWLVMWEFLDVWTVVFEFAVGICVLWPRLFRWTLIWASIFHIAVLFIMNIPILAMMFIYLPIISGNWVSESPETTHKLLLAPTTPRWFLVSISGLLIGLGAIGMAGPWARFRLSALLGIHSITFFAVVGLIMLVTVLLVAFRMPLRPVRKVMT